MGRLKRFIPADHPLHEPNEVLEALSRSEKAVIAAIQILAKASENDTQSVREALREINEIVSVPRETFPDIPDHSDNFKALEAMIGSLPTEFKVTETDLTHVEDMLELIARKVEEPMEIDMPEPPKKQWRFDVTYDKFTNDIESVVATEL